MIITGKRIRVLDKHLVAIKKQTRIVIGLSDLTRFEKILLKIGFSRTLAIGETILPPSTFGSIAEYNANGTIIIHRNKKKETCYRQVEWHWTEWHGRYNRIERSKIADVPYKRYPRTFVPPPAIEFTIASSTNGDRILSTKPILYNKTNEVILLHIINLFLEIFGECSILTGKLDHILRVPMKRLNWHVLPQGEMPWNQLQTRLQPIVAKAPKGNQVIIRYRLESINSYRPLFVAIGRSGFHGYIIFGFPKKGTFILESIYHGNATYVFDKDWQNLSQLTKAEILNQNLHKDRIIHRSSWHSKVKKLLK